MEGSIIMAMIAKWLSHPDVSFAKHVIKTVIVSSAAALIVID